MSKALNETSKFLSYILRHEPQAMGVALDPEGWTDINELINCANKFGKAIDRDVLQQVVDTSDKKRFTISEDGLRIRAAQGHSTDSVAITYPEKEPPEFLYHGTATRFLDAILQEGLKSQERQHVHLSTNIETATVVGQRYGKPVILQIEAKLMHEQGFMFYLSDNGVWLSHHIPKKFIQAP